MNKMRFAAAYVIDSENEDDVLDALDELLNAVTEDSVYAAASIVEGKTTLFISAQEPPQSISMSRPTPLPMAVNDMKLFAKDVVWVEPESSSDGMKAVDLIMEDYRQRWIDEEIKGELDIFASAPESLLTKKHVMAAIKPKISRVHGATHEQTADLDAHDKKTNDRQAQEVARKAKESQNAQSEPAVAPRAKKRDKAVEQDARQGEQSQDSHPLGNQDKSLQETTQLQSSEEGKADDQQEDVSVIDEGGNPMSGRREQALDDEEERLAGLNAFADKFLM